MSTNVCSNMLLKFGEDVFRAVVMAILLGGGCKMKILPTERAWQLIEFHFMNLYVKFADMPV